MTLKRLNSREIYFAALLMLIGLAMLISGPDGTLDAKYFYTSGQANEYLRGLSSSRAQAYLRNEVMDLFFLMVYSLFFYFLARRLSLRKAWMAFIPGFFDLIETATIVFLLLSKASDVPFWLGSITCLKWTTGFMVGTFIFVRFAQSKQNHVTAP